MGVGVGSTCSSSCSPVAGSAAWDSLIGIDLMVCSGTRSELHCFGKLNAMVSCAWEFKGQTGRFFRLFNHLHKSFIDEAAFNNHKAFG